MSRRSHRVNQRAKLAKASNGLLQAKCACGGRTSLSGDCRSCRETNVRRNQDGSGRAAAPGSVHNVVNSPGQPLDKATRAFMESRLGHDFSNVRVHTDARATQSANAISAQAYTVGRNVVFASGKYVPSTDMGKQLIAHELTHVVQQSGTRTVNSHLVLDTPRDRMEGQAEEAGANINHEHSVHPSATGSAIVQRQPAPAPPAKTPPTKPAGKSPAKPPEKKYPVANCPFPSDFKDEHESGSNMMCVADESFEKAPECNLTDKHFELINTAKEAARKRVQRAESRMHWLGGPEYAERIGKKIFKGEPPEAAKIKETLGKMVKILSGSTMKFRGATCADSLCESKGQHAAAYESGPTEPVALCPRSFLPNYLPKLPQTIIHEAVHLAGIDIDPDITERYCDQKTCEEACQDATSADAWALFIDCLGGPLIKPVSKTP